jgi:hypothetical protein
VGAGTERSHSRWKSRYMYAATVEILDTKWMWGYTITMENGGERRDHLENTHGSDEDLGRGGGAGAGAGARGLYLPNYFITLFGWQHVLVLLASSLLLPRMFSTILLFIYLPTFSTDPASRTSPAVHCDWVPELERRAMYLPPTCITHITTAETHQKKTMKHS